MSPRNKLTIIIPLFVFLITTLAGPAQANQATSAVKVSGGEQHTLVLTADKAVWACGDKRIQKGFFKIFCGRSDFLHLRPSSFVFIVEGRMYATAITRRTRANPDLQTLISHLIIWA